MAGREMEAAQVRIARPSCYGVAQVNVHVGHMGGKPANKTRTQLQSFSVEVDGAENVLEGASERVGAAVKGGRRRVMRSNSLIAQITVAG